MLAQLTALEEGTAYSITVTATLNDNGETAVETIIATTMSVGEYTSQNFMSLYNILNLKHIQFHLLLPPM